MKKLHILIPSLVAAIGMPLISMVGCGGDTPEPEVVADFEKDSWENVCNYANQGLDALANHYGLKPLDFVGKKRYVKLNGLDHEVMVVGVNQDTYTDKDGINHCAALTFRFNNVVSNSEGNALTIAWETDATTKGAKDYWTSTLHNALNSLEDNVEWWHNEERQSVYSMIAEGNSKLASNIKSVNESVLCYVDESWRLVTQPTKLFCPKLSDIYSDVGINQTTSPILEPLEKSQYMAEDDQYYYYVQNVGDNTFDEHNKCLIVADLNGEIKDNLLTTPSVHTNAFIDCWIVESSGGLGIMGVSQPTHSPAPLFCI